MPTRRLALCAVLALVAMPSSALAQSAGDDQYTDPVPEAPQAPPQTGGGGGGGGGGGAASSGSGGDSQSQPPGTGSNGSTVSSSNGSDSGPGASSSDGSLPRTGLPVGILAITGFILAASGRVLRRVAKDPSPDPHAPRAPDVPLSSPVARAKRNRPD